MYIHIYINNAKFSKKMQKKNHDIGTYFVAVSNALLNALTEIKYLPKYSGTVLRSIFSLSKDSQYFQAANLSDGGCSFQVELTKGKVSQQPLFNYISDRRLTACLLLNWSHFTSLWCAIFNFKVFYLNFCVSSFLKFHANQ